MKKLFENKRRLSIALLVMLVITFAMQNVLHAEDPTTPCKVTSTFLNENYVKGQDQDWTCHECSRDETGTDVIENGKKTGTKYTVTSVTVTATIADCNYTSDKTKSCTQSALSGGNPGTCPSYIIVNVGSGTSIGNTGTHTI
jgi:hypothetical protein